ncbi:MAG: CAP domain-containing protein [Bacteroidia bacterium]|nr:CAP domain-containing protein [Bacteroidia bacterium]
MNFTNHRWAVALIIIWAMPFLNKMYAQEEVSILDIRKGVYKNVNDYRQELRLNRLQAKSGLNKLAQEHAVDMAEGRVEFSHKGFDKRYKAAKNYFKRGITMAENIYFSTYPSSEIAEGSLNGWIESPPHHKALKGKYSYTGIGVAKGTDGSYFVVQLYAE